MTIPSTSLVERIAAIIDPVPFEPMGRGRAERYFRDGDGHFRRKQAIAKAQSILNVRYEVQAAAQRGPIGKRSELVARIANELGRWSSESARTREWAERCLKIIDHAGLELRRKATRPHHAR